MMYDVEATSTSTGVLLRGKIFERAALCGAETAERSGVRRA